MDRSSCLTTGLARSIASATRVPDKQRPAPIGRRARLARSDCFGKLMNLKIARSATVLSFVLLAGHAQAAGDVAAGKEKAEICAACHGEQGLPDMTNVPALSGQSDNYLQWRLVYFREGRRKNDQM